MFLSINQSNKHLGKLQSNPHSYRTQDIHMKQNAQLQNIKRFPQVATPNYSSIHNSVWQHCSWLLVVH